MQDVSEIISSINKELDVIEKDIKESIKVGTDTGAVYQHSTGFPQPYVSKLNGFISNLTRHNQTLIKILQNKHDIQDLDNGDKKKIMQSLQKLEDREKKIDTIYHKVFKFTAKHNLIEMNEGEHSPKIGSNPIIYKFLKGSIDNFLKSKLELEHAINSIKDKLEVHHKRLHG